MKRQRRSQILLSLVLFVFIYLYVDIYQTSTAIKYLIIGASSGGIAFILFNKRVSPLRKGVFVSVIMVLILILPFLKEKKPVITRENRLLEGLWSTDSSGGYSIRIRIQDDSAFVSQVILQFGGKITMPPTDAFDRVDVYRVNNRDEVKGDFDLWIDNTESELTLLLRIIDLDTVPKYAIEDLRVL